VIDERTETGGTAEAVEETADGTSDEGTSDEGGSDERTSDEGPTVEGLATPGEDEPAAGNGATDDGGSITGRVAAGRDAERPAGMVRTAPDAEGVGVRSLRLAISLTAVFGYALLFGAAVGGAGHLLLLALDGTVRQMATRIRIVGGAALLLPAAAFLFLALYDGADLARPSWP
jgi:hypothetical protein